jgi:hypothetical protein
LREAGEVYVEEVLGQYVVEKSGSRRSSVERREEILNVALSVLAERGYRGASMLRSPDALKPPRRRSTPGSETSEACSRSWLGGKQNASTP